MTPIAEVPRNPLITVMRAPFAVVWYGLVAATLTSFWLGTDRALSSPANRSILILIVAFVKVRFVGLYFMELREAPTILRALFECYCVAVCAMLIGLYLFV